MGVLARHPIPRATAPIRTGERRAAHDCFRCAGGGGPHLLSHCRNTFPEDENFDIGSDTRTGVAKLEYRYEPPFKFTGEISKLTFKLVPDPNPATESKAELGTTGAPEPDPIEVRREFCPPQPERCRWRGVARFAA